MILVSIEAGSAGRLPNSCTSVLPGFPVEQSDYEKFPISGTPSITRVCGGNFHAAESRFLKFLDWAWLD
jgi:hypothetical protein